MDIIINYQRTTQMVNFFPWLQKLLKKGKKLVINLSSLELSNYVKKQKQ